MTRIKLFVLFTAMAWASLIRPNIGLEMIGAAIDGSEIKRVRKRVDDAFGRGRPYKRKSP